MTKSRRDALLAALAVSVLFGCSSSDPPSVSAESLAHGNVSLALVATGNSGTQYRLSNANVILNRQGSPRFTYTGSLDTDAVSLSFKVPVGSYFATLQNLSGSAEWTLQRLASDGSVAGTVTATLVTPLPAELIVTANTDTPIVFTFSIPSNGTVTFDYGTVTVSIDTQEITYMQYGFQGDAAALIPTAYFGGPYQQTLQAQLPGTGSAMEALVSGITGNWYLVQGQSNQFGIAVQVCTDTSAQAYAPPTNGAAFQDLVYEANGGTATMCLTDVGNAQNQMEIYLTRVGTPTTPTFSALTGQPLRYEVYYAMMLNSNPFDSTSYTIDFAKLVTNTSFSYVNFFVRLADDTNHGWYAAQNTSSNMQLTIAPH